MENWTIATIWERLSGRPALADAYPEGYVSHRKDGQYKKEGREWVKIPGSKGTDSDEMEIGSHFTIKHAQRVLMGGKEANEEWNLVVGDEVTDREKIAEGHGVKNIERIKEKVSRLFNITGTKNTDWTKAKGIGQVSDGGKIYVIELHWYEIKGHGKIFYKEKYEESV